MPDAYGYWTPGEPGWDEHKAKVVLALHRLEHSYGACPCSTPPPEPTFADQLEEWRQRGHQAADEATAQGVNLGQITDGELIALGRAAREADLALALEQVKARNQHGAHGPTPPDHTTPTRAKELALVQRHNSAIVSGDDRYKGLELDKLFQEGKPILHLDPLGEGQDASTVEHDGPAQDGARGRGTLPPKQIEPDENGGIDTGQGGSRRRQRGGNRRRGIDDRSVSYVDNARKNPMRDDPDDDEWS